MKSSPVFLEQVMKILVSHGRITSRAMFGGYGIYFEGVIFASIVEDKLYFRVDEKNRKDFEKYKSTPFVYEGGKRPVEMPYLSLPEEVFHHPQLLKKFIQNSYEASLRHQSNKKNKKIRPSVRAKMDLD